MTNAQTLATIKAQPGITDAKMSQQLGNDLLVITFDNNNMLEIEGKFSIEFYEAKTDQPAKRGGASDGGG